MTLAILHSALSDKNVRAFLRVIRAGESGQTDAAYTIMFGGSHFTGWQHPNRVITAGGYSSTAAGAYQFLNRTWKGLVRQYAFPDFSPANQDVGAVALIAGRGALQDVIAGRFEAAVARCGKEWASLPGSPYGQPVMAMDKARRVYVQYGGAFTKQEQPAAVNKPNPGTIIPKGEPMPFLALLSAFGPLIAQLIPQIAKAVGGGERAQQNVAAAEAIFNTVVAASGQPNIQSAVEAMQADPVLVETVTKAVVTDPQIIGLMEIGGGVKAAREASIVMQNAERSFLRNPAFWISMFLLVMPYMLLADVFYIHPESYEGAMRTQIVTGILAVIMMVGGFWIGSSMASQSKDAVIDRAVK